MIATTTTAPLIVITAGLTKQGSSVLRALIESSRLYRIRAIVSLVEFDGTTAQQLSAFGIEVVAVDWSSVSFCDAIMAFAGAACVFAATSFWDHLSQSKEEAEGRMMVDAAKAVNVELFIWSGLPSLKALSNGVYSKASHFESKAAVAAYARTCDIPIVDVQASLHPQYLLNLIKPVLVPTGKFVASSPLDPSAPIALLDLDADYGKFVRAVIESSAGRAQEQVMARAELLPVSDFVEKIARVSGKDVIYEQISSDDYTKRLVASGLPAHACEAICEPLLVVGDPGVAYPLKTSREAEQLPLAKSLKSMNDWVKEQNWIQILS